MTIFFYVLVVIVAWLGLRHLISMFMGQDLDGPLLRGQRLCHFISLALLWGGCATALFLNYSWPLHRFWPLIVAFFAEIGFRKHVVRSGYRDQLDAGINGIKEQLEVIVEIEEQLRFCLHLRLRRRYEAELDSEIASVLAVQVTNHLMGDDFAKAYKTLTPEVQEKVDAVSVLIEPRVHEAMTEDASIRELIIRHIMTTYLIYHCLFDEAWFDKPEIRNKKRLLGKYDCLEFSQVDDFERYMAFAADFMRTQWGDQQEQG